MVRAMAAFTLFHVVLSVAGIVAGFGLVFGMMGGKLCRGWSGVFLATTVATSGTGFLFPIHQFTPALGLGLLSLVVLGLALFALYGRRLGGVWRGVYVVSAVLALYFNFFVLIVQSFLKIPALHALAPTQAEPPFAIAQGAALLFFVVLGVLAFRKFRPAVGGAI
jgi:hypothetical protein